MTICHFLGDFAYTRIFGKRSRIARNGPGHAFVHFFKKTCLNRADFETISASSSCRNPSIFNRQSSMAELPSLHGKTGTFRMFLHTFQQAKFTDAAWGNSNRSVRRWQTSRAALGNIACGVGNRPVRRWQIPRFEPCFSPFCEVCNN